MSNFFEAATKTGRTVFGKTIYTKGGVEAIACTPSEVKGIRDAMGDGWVASVRLLVSRDDVKREFPMLDQSDWAASPRAMTEAGVVICIAGAKLAERIGLRPWSKEAAE